MLGPLLFLLYLIPLGLIFQKNKKQKVIVPFLLLLHTCRMISQNT